MKDINFMARKNVRGSKQVLLESIMTNVRQVVERALNENAEFVQDDDEDDDIFEMEEDIFEMEADENGVIQLTTTSFMPDTGNRETMDIDWEITKLKAYEDTYEVRATVINSENPAFRVGYDIDFEIDKNANYDVLKDTLDYEVNLD